MLWLLSWGRQRKGVEVLDPGSRESEFSPAGGRASRGSERCRSTLRHGMGRGRGAPSSGPRTRRSRGVVEAPRRAGLVRVGAGVLSRRPVERASYESEPGCCRGAPSSRPRTSRSRGAVEAPRRAGLVRDWLGTRSRWAIFYCGFGRVSFLAISAGTPVLLVPTVLFLLVYICLLCMYVWMLCVVLFDLE
jgi:hypothetical protein